MIKSLSYSDILDFNGMKYRLLLMAECETIVNGLRRENLTHLQLVINRFLESVQRFDNISSLRKMYYMPYCIINLPLMFHSMQYICINVLYVILYYEFAFHVHTN